MSGLSFLNNFSNRIPRRHKVFISYHHADQIYKNTLEQEYSDHFDGFISCSVQDGDIPNNIQTETVRQRIRDNYISDSTVTIVLIGQGTWRRKHVDWEISSSIRNTQFNSRNGLLGILLPTYNGFAFTKTTSSSFGLSGLHSHITEDGVRYNPFTIPPRLYDNVKCDFAKLYNWNTNTLLNIRDIVHSAFQRRTAINPDNSYPSFANNRSESQTVWTY